MGETLRVEVEEVGRVELPAGTTVADLLAATGERFGPGREDVLAAVVDGSLVDLSAPLRNGAVVGFVRASSDAGREVLRHSTAHVLAQAVLRLWPGAHYAIGPAIADGFYYDFELPGGVSIHEDDLSRIEGAMREIVAADQPFSREEVSLDEARAVFADQPFKLEVLDAIEKARASAPVPPGPGPGAGPPARPDAAFGAGVSEGPASSGAGAPEGLAGEAGGEGGVVTLYRNDAAFVDLCRGPHVPSTGRLGHFRLLRVAGAYWRGDERRPQLQRVYGTAFESAEALAEHLRRLEEAERRDHRRIGAELDLFSFPDAVGSGLPVFHPKGGLVRRLMEDYSRERHEAAGYELVFSPHVTKADLFETSGHLEWFAESMYPPMELDDGQRYYLKPMNCPFHILVYRSRSRSYRELPMRLFELGTVYRYEKSGVVHGLTRVRGMTQDDAHIFCTREQLADELSSLLRFVLELLAEFGLEDFSLELSTRPEGKAAGSLEEWDEATAALEAAARAAGLELALDPGGGAFYGPKISVEARDAIGRSWQISTIQLDFQLPRRFGLAYVGADNSRHRPVMIHRALFGSVERFLGVLLEHYAGALPAWLSPVQARVLPVRDAHGPYAAAVREELRRAGLRADVEDATEPLGARIRRAKLERVPYVLVVGDEDVAAGTVGVNARGAGAPERGVPLGAFRERLVEEVATRAVGPVGRGR